MTEALSCRHVHDGSPPILTLPLDTDPPLAVALCADCLIRQDRYTHLALTARGLDPAQTTPAPGVRSP